MKLLANMFISLDNCDVQSGWNDVAKKEQQQKLMFAPVMLASLRRLGGLFVKDTPSEFVFFFFFSITFTCCFRKVCLWGTDLRAVHSACGGCA